VFLDFNLFEHSAASHHGVFDLFVKRGAVRTAEACHIDLRSTAVLDQNRNEFVPSLGPDAG
jgi:hypothetical protein